MSAQLKPLIYDFSAGEVSPKVSRRSDLPLHFKSVGRMENFIPTSQGPAYFRAGTAYVAPARVTTGNAPLLVPFKASDGLSYILEFSVSQLRVLNDDGLIVTAPLTVTTISEVAGKYGYYNVTFTVGSGHGINAGQSVLLDGYAELGRSWVDGYWPVQSVTSTTIKINNIYGGVSGLTSGGTVKADAVFSTPYVEADFRSIQFAQANDVMYVVHPNYPPRKVTRTSDTSWSCSTYSRTTDPFASSGDYPSCVCFHQQSLVMGGTTNDPLKWFKSVPGNFDDFTLGSAADDATSYTFSSETYASIRSIKSVDGALIFTCSDKNRRITGSVTATTPPTIQDIDTDGSGPVIPAANDRSLISVTKDLRRVKSLSYEYEAGGAVATDITKAADHLTSGGISQLCFQSFLNNANWAMKAEGTLIGLNQDVQEQVMGWYRFTTRSGDLIQSIAARPVDGGFDELWMVIDRSVGGERVKYIEKLVLEGDIKSRDEFLTGDKAQDDLDYENYLFEQQKQRIHLDCSLTYDGSEQEASLTLDNLGGPLVTATASASTFAADDVGREIWAKEGEGRLIIETYISATKVSGRTTKSFGTLDFSAGDWYLTADSVTGLNHLEGETVTAVADGAPHHNLTVTGGAVDLPKQASVVHVGLRYTGWIKSQNLEGDGISGQKKNIYRARVFFQDSLGASVGANPYNMEKIPFRNAKSRVGRPPALYTGMKDISFDSGSSEEKHVYIKQDQPCPCVIQMIQPHVRIGEM